MFFVTTKQKIRSILALSLIGLLTLYLYIVQIQGTNEYMGMRPLEYDVSRIVVSVFLVSMLFLVFPPNSSSPLNVFFGIYVLFTIFWISFLSDVSGYVDLVGLFSLFLLLVFPVVFLRFSVPFLEHYFEKFDFSFMLLRHIRKEWFLVVFLIIVLVLISQRLGFSLSFSDSYVRRMSARIEISGLLAYALSSALNGIAPFLAFMGVYTRKYLFFVTSFIFVVAGFGFLGTKAPIMFVLLMGMVGFCIRIKLVSIVNLFLYSVLSVCIVSVAEYTLFGFSWIADIIVRRGFIVVPQNQGYYLDFFFHHTDLFNFIFGQPNGSSISFLIGEMYYGDPNTNANTNAFLYELGRNGILGYLLSVIFLSFFYAFLNTLYKKYCMNEAIGVSVIYSLLIVEQSYSTALITSGITLLILYAMLSVEKKVRYDCYS